MIDFKNASFMKLSAANYRDFASLVDPILVDGEEIIGTYRSVRDGVIFTSKRIVAINIQGLTGKKKDFTSLPYSKIQAFSIETAGVLDLDSELELWFSGMGVVKFDFSANCNISAIAKSIGEHVL